MRQNRMVRASSVWARRGVWLGWAIFLLGEGRLRWPPFYLLSNPRNTHLEVRHYRKDEKRTEVFRPRPLVADKTYNSGVLFSRPAGRWARTAAPSRYSP